MKENRFILFMDVLGTKAIVNSGSYDSLINLIEYFTSNNRKFEFSLEKSEENGEYVCRVIEPTISNFSDHIVVSYPSNYLKHPITSPKESIYPFTMSLINIAIKLHKKALEQGKLMRGVFTEGVLLHNGNSIIGEALNEAIALEENIAIYPRVIVPDKVVKIISDCSIDCNFISLARDFDGIYFIDYLKSRVFMGFNEDLLASFIKLREIIEAHMKKYDVYDQNEISKLAKWNWLANKFDESLDFFYKKETKIQNELIKISKFNILQQRP